MLSTLGRIPIDDLKAAQRKISRTFDGLKADDTINEAKQEPYADSTKMDFLKIGKPFFAWLHSDDKEFVSWIRTGSYKPTVGQEEILTRGRKRLDVSGMQNPER